MRNNLFLCRIDGDYLKYLHGKDEADCEFKVKDISGLENDGTVIL